MYRRSVDKIRTVAILLIAGLTISTAAVGQQRQAINFGLTGSWFEPATSGQGFLLDVVVGQDPPRVVLYWFTYTSEAGGAEGQRWFIAVGTYQPGDSGITLDILMPTGGAFDTRPPEPDVVTIGAAEIEFHSCTEATFTYDINLDGDDSQHVTGEIPIQRATADVECQNLADEAGEHLTAVPPNEVLKEVVDQDCVAADDLDSSTPLLFIEHSAALLSRCNPKHDLIDVQGNQLTAGEWFKASGNVGVTCIEEGTQYDFSFEGLVPNGVYTIWHFPGSAGGALASHPGDIHNIFTAAASGTTTFSVVGTAGVMTFNGSVGACTRPLGTTTPLRTLFVVVYHTDNFTWGELPGPQDKSTAHLVFVP